jgi:hypothetical protein
MTVELTERKIHLVRGQQVAPSALIQAVKRNRDRFPDEFMFQVSKEENAILGCLAIQALRVYARSRPRFSVANAPYRSTLRSCGLSSGCGNCSQRIKTCFKRSTL